MFMAKAQQWQVGPAVQWNILNYGQITNQVRAQDAAFQAAIFAYQNTVLQAQREVEDGLAQFLQSQLRTQLQARAAAAAKRSLDLSVLQYREGIVDFTTVLTAQQQLLSATTVDEMLAREIRMFRRESVLWRHMAGMMHEPARLDAIQTGPFSHN